MKVFYIDPQSYNNLSLYDYSLLTHVQGHDVTYYYSDMYQLQKFPVQHSVCCFHYSGKRLGIMKALSYMRSIIRIYRDVIRQKPDVVHVQWTRLWMLDYLFAKMLKKRGVRLVYTAHNTLPHMAKPADVEHFKKYYQTVDSIIVHSELTKSELERDMSVPAEKLNVIRHGVLEADVNEEEVQSRVEELRKLLQIKPGQLVFSCLGVQKLYKGTDLAVQAWMNHPELCENPNCKLLAIGRNHEIDYKPLENCHNAVVLDEMVTDLDFEAYLRLSSVVLLPYRKISQSGLLFSAVCCQTPMIVTRIGGLSEPFKYGKIGWIIDKPAVDLLSKCMLDLVAHPEKVQEIRGDATSFLNVCQAYSWTTIGAQTSELYKGISMMR